jgi:hypothetical protein
MNFWPTAIATVLLGVSLAATAPMNPLPSSPTSDKRPTMAPPPDAREIVEVIENLDVLENLPLLKHLEFFRDMDVIANQPPHQSTAKPPPPQKEKL